MHHNKIKNHTLPKKASQKDSINLYNTENM